MRFVDVMLTIPLLLIAAVLGRRAADIPGLTTIFPPDSIYLLAIVIALASWLTIARVIRAEFLSLREKEYVEAARAIGTKNGRIIRKHLLPNVAGTIIVNATLLIATAILVETALSFVGLGVSASQWSLGKLIVDNQNAFNTRPWLFWWPGLFIVVIALTINFIGDGLRDAYDPRQTRVRQ
jgi:peptide/nickel transport system permease protein